MSIEVLHSVFAWVAIVAAVLAAIATIGTWWTGKVVDQRQAAKIAALEHEVAVVQPRRLSDDQHQRLIERVSQHKGKVGMASHLMDGESSDFANMLGSAFAAAGWEVVPQLRTSLNDLPGFLSVFVTGPNLEATANVVCQALKDVGLDCHPEQIAEGSIGGAREADTVYIVVGRK